jgi:diguanylate cyclase (GGDEF)-like protein
MADVPEVLEHIRKLLRDNEIPPLEGELAGIPELCEIHEELTTIRETVYAFSAGDLSPEIKIRGIIPGCMKTLQSHLRHLIWQIQMVEKGDFTQQVEYLGDFSTAFNGMIFNMETAFKELRKRAVELQGLADHDSLTGALNRRSFMAKADAELKAATNKKISSCLVMMDIDFFKNFNDTWGHQAGDDALRHVVSLISSQLRKNDFLGRYGGEEFLLYFDRVNRDIGVSIAERIRRAINETPVLIESGQAPISASFGVAMLEDVQAEADGNNVLAMLIRNADFAMYRSKQDGRNRVTCFEKEMAGKL